MFVILISKNNLFAAGHHPDLHLVGWNNVTIEIWTHAVGKYSLLMK
jgi:pterin-4a-carbinolamine dehydratase